MSQAAMKLPAEQKLYTYDDYLAFDDGRRYELIDGVIYDMAAPGDVHQTVVHELSFQLEAYLRGKTCEVKVSPYDVKLNERNVFQPDVSVICDPPKIKPFGIEGAPDFIAEVVSRSSSSYDTITKRAKYMKAGVREYWVIFPEEKSVMVVINHGDHEDTLVYDADKKAVKVYILDDLYIDLELLFAKVDRFDKPAASNVLAE